MGLGSLGGLPEVGSLVLQGYTVDSGKPCRLAPVLCTSGLHALICLGIARVDNHQQRVQLCQCPTDLQTPTPT